MSSAVDSPDDERDALECRRDVDLEDVEIRDDVELSPIAGERGVPIDAICTGCKAERVKRIPVDEIDIDSETGTFRHVCHSCRKGRWYNVLAIRWDLIETDGGDAP